MIEVFAGILIAAGIEKMRRDNDEGGYSEAQSYESSSPEQEPQQADQSNSVSEYEHRTNLHHYGPFYREVDGVRIYADTRHGLGQAINFVRGDRPQEKNVKRIIASKSLAAQVDSTSQGIRRGSPVLGHAHTHNGTIFVNSGEGNFRKTARHEAAHVLRGKDEAMAEQAESDRGWWSL